MGDKMPIFTPFFTKWGTLCGHKKGETDAIIRRPKPEYPIPTPDEPRSKNACLQGHFCDDGKRHKFPPLVAGQAAKPTGRGLPPPIYASYSISLF